MWNDVFEKEWEKRSLPDSHAHLLTYSKGSVSFAMDGSGNHYIFDMTWKE
ncbi:hypothetical protein [Paenibacillus illinoisensis]